MPAVTPGRYLTHGLITSLIFCLLAMSLPSRGCAGEALVAVAANFAEVLQQLEAEFERASGHELTVVSGSSGKLYAQISQGAPFDVLLAADRERPQMLEDAGLAVPGTRFTYAIGRLALWSPKPDYVAADGATTLRKAEFRRLAIANPALAPYGVAARETLERLGLYEQLRHRLVIGENIGQAFAMVATGNAELGLVAMSYVTSPRNEWHGSRWEVPGQYHTEIRQDAVLLKRAAENTAATALLDWLRSPRARALIENFGYSIE